MKTIFETALELQEFCDGQGWRSCFIGGIAVQRWGQARVTRDVDVTLLTGFGNESEFIDLLLLRYAARVTDPAQFALRARVLLLRSADGVGIDVSLGALPFEELVIARASGFEFMPGVALRTCSPEDLIVMKLFALRPIDVRDVEGVAVRHGRQLDWEYIETQLAPLAEAKEQPEILAELERVRRLA